MNPTTAQDLEDVSFLLPFLMKQRKKKILDGVKSYKRKEGEKTYNLTNGSYLLFELNKISHSKDKK